MEQVLGLYGYRAKKGFLCCPFHGEKEPSLKVYRDTGGWHCFGCGKGGSVIDFVMEHEGCSFPAAVRAIDSALRLGLCDVHEDPQDARQWQRIQKSMDNFVESVYAWCDMLIRIAEASQARDLAKVKQLEEKRAADVQSLTADEWTKLLAWKEESQYTDYQIEKIHEFKEEVAAWRRRARRTG